MSASVSQYADLVGKRILLTGASSGIGAGMAGVLAQQGCHLVLHYHHNQTGIAKTLETVLALGRKPKYCNVIFVNWKASKLFLTRPYMLTCSLK